MNIFWGMKILWISQNWTILMGHFYACKGLFFWSRYKIGDYFLGLLKFQIFGGVLEIPDIVWR